jgi:hypothetical protein
LARCSRIQRSRSATSGAAQFLPDSLTPLGVLAVYRAFDLEQGIDPPDRLQRQRRDHACRLALCLAAGVGRDIGHDEERPAGMHPARRLQSGPGWRSASYSLLYPAKASLKRPGIVGQMRLGMLAGPPAV